MTGPSVACVLADLDDGKPRACKVGGQAIAVVKLNERVFAVDGVCPHRGGPLAEGFVAEDCIVCPWHGWGFHLDTGRYVGSPGVGIRSYPTEVRDGQVFVSV